MNSSQWGQWVQARGRDRKEGVSRSLLLLLKVAVTVHLPKPFGLSLLNRQRKRPAMNPMGRFPTLGWSCGLLSIHRKELSFSRKPSSVHGERRVVTKSCILMKSRASNLCRQQMKEVDGCEDGLLMLFIEALKAVADREDLLES